MPTVVLPRPFTLIFDDGRRVEFPGPGRYNVDDEIGGHPFMRRLLVKDEQLGAGPPLSGAVVQQPSGHLPNPPRQFPVEDNTGQRAVNDMIPIPDEWDQQHHMVRIALARKLAPGAVIDNAAQADTIVAAEVQRRGPAGVDAEAQARAAADEAARRGDADAQVRTAERAAGTAGQQPAPLTALLPLTPLERTTLAELRTPAPGRTLTIAETADRDALAARENVPAA